MIDATSTVTGFSTVWQYVGPLIGVGFGYLISDRVWDRQKQWEMKRDAVLEAVRALGELELALINIRSVYYTYQGLEGEDAKAKRKDSLSKLLESNSKFYSAMFVADLCVGDEFGSSLSKYFQTVGSVTAAAEAWNLLSCTSEKLKEIVDLGKDVIQLARRKLKIRDADRAVV